MGPGPDKVASLCCSLSSPRWFSAPYEHHHAPKGAARVALPVQPALPR